MPRGTLLAAARGPEVEEYLHEAMILAIGLCHPRTLERFESQFETVEMRDPGHDRLRHAMLRQLHAEAPDDGDGFRRKVAAAAAEEVEKLMGLAHVRIAPPVRNRSDADLAMMCLAEEFAKLEARRGAQAEIAEAMEDLGGHADEGLTWRLMQAAAAPPRGVFRLVGGSVDFALTPPPGLPPVPGG
jgi:DNA primase